MDERTATLPDADHGGMDDAGYRQLIDASPIPIAVIEPDTTVRLWNTAAERLFGWTADEVIGRPIQIVPDAKRDECQCAYDAIARGETVVGVETQHRTKDARLVDVSISGAPLFDAKGDVARMMLVFQDVGGRRRSKEQHEIARRDAEDAQRRFGFLAEASAVLASSLDYATTLEHVARLAVPVLADYCVIDIVTEDGEFHRVAAAHADPAKDPLVKQLRGQTPSPDVLERVSRVMATGEPDVVAELDLERALTQLPHEGRRQLVRSLGPRSYIVVALRARGSSMGTMTFVYAESGRRYRRADVALAQELARRAAVALDNARLYQAERDAHAEAQAANRAKDEFLSMVSHELRTPLQAMLGWVAVLRQGKLAEPKRARALDIIEQSGRAQARLIADLLDVSRMVTGRLRIDPRPVTLPPIIQAAVDAVQPAADAKRVHVRCLFDPTVSPVAGDPDRLQQVVWNLLSNAVKFTPSGGRVELRLERDDAQVRIVVTDTGEGIAPDFLPHVFERFRQAEDVRSPKRRGGVGLGLAIVRHLVELHGGRVLVDSRGPGHGATFAVVLPIAPLDAKPNDSDAEAQHSHR